MLIFRIFAPPDLTPECLLIVQMKPAYLASNPSKILNAYYLAPFIFSHEPQKQ